MAMNDTNAFVGEGLFPVLRDTTLVLEEEVVAVLLSSKGLKVTRRYQVMHSGDTSETVELGVVCLPAYLLSGEPVEERYKRRLEGAKVSVDGIPKEGVHRIDRLVDAGTHVVVSAKTMAELEDCAESNDGDICGHAWLAFSAQFKPRQVRTVEVTWTAAPSPYRFVDSALDSLSFYSEKFFRGDSVPRIELHFAVEGVELAENVFNVNVEPIKHPGLVQEYRAGRFTWCIQNYVPVKEDYRYRDRMYRHDTLDQEAIERAYRSIVSPSATGEE